jgi:23S rRNA pseudouridine2605 synthase
MIRLQKFLSRAGLASRRGGETLIRDGRVRVNGELATEPGVRVDPETDTVELDGRKVELGPPVWIALHKPRGYVSTRRDPQGRPTLYDLLPDECVGLFHVGRLDVESEGLVLLTNQGDLANRLLHPRYEIDREYRVEVEGRVSAAAVRRLLNGVTLDDGPARARAVKRLRAARSGHSQLAVVLREGRKREVRRMFEAIGHPVQRLLRVRFGPVSLGRLPPGRWRALSRDETGAIARTTDPKRRGSDRRRSERGRSDRRAR